MCPMVARPVALVPQEAVRFHAAPQDRIGTDVAGAVGVLVGFDSVSLPEVRTHEVNELTVACPDEGGNADGNLATSKDGRGFTTPSV